MARRKGGSRPTITVKVGELSEAIAETLDLYRDDVIAEINRISEKVATETVKDLKATSPRKTGEYARGWRKKLTGRSVYGSHVYTVHNARKPGLTHLLEKGHLIATRVKGKYVSTGKRSDPVVHIEPAAERAAERMVQEVSAIDI